MTEGGGGGGRGGGGEETEEGYHAVIGEVEALEHLEAVEPERQLNETVILEVEREQPNALAKVVWQTEKNKKKININIFP